MNKRAGTGGRRGARGRAPRTGYPARPGQRRAHLRMAVRAGPGAAAGGESQLAGAGARRAWWGFRHVSDVGTTWGPRPAHATAHSGVEAPAEKPAEAGGGTGLPLRSAPPRPGAAPVPPPRSRALGGGGPGGRPRSGGVRSAAGRRRAGARVPWRLSVPGGSRPLRSAPHTGEVGAGAAPCGQPRAWFRRRSSEMKKYPARCSGTAAKGRWSCPLLEWSCWVFHLSILCGCGVGISVKV